MITLEIYVNSHKTSLCVQPYWSLPPVCKCKQWVSCICDCLWECVRTFWAHLLMLVYSHASICFIIQETGTHHHDGNRGIQCCSATFISLKIQTERTYVVVCNMQHVCNMQNKERFWLCRGNKERFWLCRGSGCLALNEKSTVEKIQRGNFTPAYEQGSE